MTVVEPPQTPSQPESVDTGFIMRTAWMFTGAAVLAAALFAVFVSVGGGFTIAYAGLAYFWLSNYTAYRCGAENYKVSPGVAAHACLGCLMLAAVSAVATIFG